jgi:hypothetical protein
MREPKNLIWGTFLILIGVLLFLERLGARLPEGGLWPLLLLALAASGIVDRRPVRTVVLLALGAICLCASFGWFGLSYTHSWPLVLVAAGLGIIVNAVAGGTRRPHLEVSHE